jgi:hypothetical protein
MTVLHAKGGGSIDLTIDVGARIRGTLPPVVRQILTAEIVRPLRASLVSGAWPVDTGASLQGWEIRAVDAETVAIRNPVEYSEFVHRAGETVEVWTEVEELSERLVSALLPRLQRLASRPTRQLPLGLVSRSVLRAATLFASKVRAFARRDAPTRTTRTRSMRRR